MFHRPLIISRREGGMELVFTSSTNNTDSLKRSSSIELSVLRSGQPQRAISCSYWIEGDPFAFRDKISFFVTNCLAIALAMWLGRGGKKGWG